MSIAFAWIAREVSTKWIRKLAEILTVEKFQRLPEDSGGGYHELRGGKVVTIARPAFRHRSLRRQLRRLLERAGSPLIAIDSEVAFRPLPEHELRVADVAVVTAEREAAIDPNGHLMGAPDLAIEVLSPSNTFSEINDKETLCLENGAREFWVVDPFRRLVKLAKPDGHTVTYRPGQSIPWLFAPETAAIAVDRIFS